MKNFIRVTIDSVILFAATILPGITAASGLSAWLYVLAGILFLLVNIFPNMFRRLPVKLKTEEGGVYLLCSFLVLLILETAYGIIAGAVWHGMFSDQFWFDALMIYVSELIVFWNGIIRVYVTSSMLGTRWRIIGILCGMIPVVNIIVLMHIIRIAGSEVAMEERRIINNEKRKDLAVCKTKYPIILVHGVFFRGLE